MKTYYINVASRTDRRKSMEDQFRELGINAERIEAVTPRDLSEAEKSRYCNPARSRWLHETELCCTRSHLLALNKFLESDADYACIFEDDVILSLALPDFISKFETSHSTSELVRLETDNKGVRLSPVRAEKIGEFSLWQSRGPTSGSAGYIVSRGAAQAICGSSRFLQVPVDHALFNPYEHLAHKYAMRHVEPALCAQWDRIGTLNSNLSESDLEAARKNRPAVENQYRMARLIQSVRDVIERELLIGPRQSIYALLGAKKRIVPFLQLDRAEPE